MMMSQTIGALAKALAAAQGEIENATKASVNSHFHNKYADLAEVLNAIREALPRHGLAVSQIVTAAGAHASVSTMLMHESGEYIAGTLALPISKPDAQGIGAAITYARRYSLAAICGISQEDDDGNTAVGLTGASAPKAAGKAPRAPKPQPVVDDAVIEAHCQKIAAAKDTQELREIYVGAYTQAKASGNNDYQKKVVGAYDKRKAELPA
jgi:hypothetical protein